MGYLHIYLASNESQYYPTDKTYILRNIGRINNQSQKLYIQPSNINYKTIENIIINSDLWEKDKVDKVDFSKNNQNNETFLSIIRKENDECVNSNLLAYFLEKDREFWVDFVEKVLKITDKNIIYGTPRISRETIGNIDLFIEVGESAIIIENKIKSGIHAKKENGYSQLEKYIEIFNDEKTNIALPSHQIRYFYLLRPDYNNQDYLVFNKGHRYVEIKYSKIYEIIKDRESDFYFNEFKRVVKKHSAEYDNELFEIMNERFIEQIKSKQ